LNHESFKIALAIDILLKITVWDIGDFLRQAFVFLAVLG